MTDAKGERPFNFGLMDIGNRREQRSDGSRWNEVIALVRAVHGEEEMRQYLEDAGCPDFVVGPVADEFAVQITMFVEMFEGMRSETEAREAASRSATPSF